MSTTTASGTLAGLKHSAAHRSWRKASLWQQEAAFLIPALHVQCQSCSCSNPAGILRGLQAGSKTWAKRMVAVWNLDGSYVDFQLGGILALMTQPPVVGQTPYTLGS